MLYDIFTFVKDFNNTCTRRGLGVLPLILAMPPSLRYMIAKGKTKKLPSFINFRGGVIAGSRAKDCLSRPATNRLYITNALLLIFLGFRWASI